MTSSSPEILAKAPVLRVMSNSKRPQAVKMSCARKRITARRATSVPVG